MNINQLFLKLKKNIERGQKNWACAKKKKIGVRELTRLGLYT
jgi:hypothetical protein